MILLAGSQYNGLNLMLQNFVQCLPKWTGAATF